MRRLLFLSISAAFILAELSCGPSNNNEMTYSGPPPRTISLDSAGAGAGPYQLELPSMSLDVPFEVPGADSCRVKIDVHNSGTTLVRNLVDSIYTPGKHKLRWNCLGNDRIRIGYGLYYYRFEICGKVSTRSFSYRPQWR
jgi:hypothetical protein